MDKQKTACCNFLVFYSGEPSSLLCSHYQGGNNSSISWGPIGSLEDAALLNFVACLLVYDEILFLCPLLNCKSITWTLNTKPRLYSITKLYAGIRWLKVSSPPKQINPKLLALSGPLGHGSTMRSGQDKRDVSNGDHAFE